MRGLWPLTRRALVEARRMPESTFPSLFVPVFFLAVNRGSLGDQFADAPFLFGQDYAAFALPVSLLFAVTGPGAGFGIVTDIDNGYFDKLLAAPVSRTTVLLGRMLADFVRNVIIATLVLLITMLFGGRVDSGVLGAVLVVLLAGVFGLGWAGFATAIALKTRNAASVNMATFVFFPLLLVSPNLLPRENMQGWLGTAAAFNPVTYVIEGIRSLILEGWDADRLLYAVIVTLVMGLGLLGLSLRILRHYND